MGSDGITYEEEIGSASGKYAKWSVVKGNFITKARVFNLALPTADSDILGSDIVPTNTPSYIRIYFVASITGVLSVMRTVSAVTIAEQLNSGVALAANAAYMFTVPWRTGDSINIQYSTTGGTILTVDILEIQGVE